MRHHLARFKELICEDSCVLNFSINQEGAQAQEMFQTVFTEPSPSSDQSEDGSSLICDDMLFLKFLWGNQAMRDSFGASQNH